MNEKKEKKSWKLKWYDKLKRVITRIFDADPFLNVNVRKKKNIISYHLPKNKILINKYKTLSINQSINLNHEVKSITLNSYQEKIRQNIH